MPGRPPKNCRGTVRRIPSLTVVFVLGCSVFGLRGQDEPRAEESQRGAAELGKIKQEQAREKLEGLEEKMERLARLLSRTDPQNAQKLRAAFRASRERLVREGMDRIIQFLNAKKLDRAIEDQRIISESLRELLAILLEKDINPRELLRHIRGIRKTLEDIDSIVQEESSEKIASAQAVEAESEIGKLSESLARLDDLVREERSIEAATTKPARLKELALKQDDVRAKTETLQTESRSGAANSKAGGGKSGTTDSSDAGLDSKSLSAAATAMKQAAEAMALGSGNAAEAGEQAKRAREQLEVARKDAEEKLDRLRDKRDFAKLKKDQEQTIDKTKDVLDRMKKTPPLVYSPDGGMPGRESVAEASSSMQSASEDLASGDASSAERSQDEALKQLDQGRQEVEQTLEALQRALRERILSYLRERFALMLKRQQKISAETRSLDARLRALSAEVPTTEANAIAETPTETAREFDRKDLQKAKGLSRREGALALICEDLGDLLVEDGTTLVFPRIVGELKNDLDNVLGRLVAVQAGALTQRIQREIQATIEEVLAAIKEAQRSPPPPNPNQGRSSKSGAGPLLPTSAELKMIRSMQQRVNNRTRGFDLDRSNGRLNLDEKRQTKLIANRQKEIEDLFRKVARALGG